MNVKLNLWIMIDDDMQTIPREQFSYVDIVLVMQ